MKEINYSIYLVTDNKNEEEFLEIIKESIRGGINLIQLREKKSTTKEFYNLAIKVKEITKENNIPLIINDRIDIALAVDAEGVHIGQEDMPCSIARKIIGENKILGVSASTIEEAIKAQKDGANYIGVGAVFPTSTKKDATYIKKDDLKEIVNSVSIPTIAIGGINHENIMELNNSGIKGIAVVSAIMSSEDPKKATEKLKEKFNEID